VATLRRAGHSSKESYRQRKEDYETEEEASAQQRVVEQLMNELAKIIMVDKIYVTCLVFLLCKAE
jgi:hypothetical protein